MKAVIDSYSGIQPFLIFKRFKIENFRPIPFFHTLDVGYSYLLCNMYGKYTDGFSIDERGFALLDAFISFIRTARNRRLENAPIPLNLLTVPNAVLNYESAPAPYDNLAYSVNGIANIVTEPIELNYLYLFRETINYELTFGSSKYNYLEVPLYLDIVLNGYLLPDSKIKAWGK